MSEQPSRINQLGGCFGPGYKSEMGRDSQHFSATIALPDGAATERLGARIAAGLRRGDAIGLEGDLGAGKTTLARAVLRALGVDENVPSPTFTLVQLYETQHFPVRHFDLYRVQASSELEELGLDEALDEGAALIEWPERAGDRLPSDMLHVKLAIEGDTSRRADLSGEMRWRDALMGS